MAQRWGNVKGKLRGWWNRASKWLECHPKTIAYIAFFLALNYFIDFLPSIIGLF